MPRYDESAKAPYVVGEIGTITPAAAVAEVERTSYLSASERIKLRTAFENNYWSAELHRLRAVFLAAMGAERRLKLRLRSVKPSESRRSRSQFR